MFFPNLFKPLVIGPIQLESRIVMAPLTRIRSREPGDIPTPLMGEYYRQRASAGLVISEATQVSFEAKGYQGAPGLHTPEQVAAWRGIVGGVHDAGGRMAIQLWHTGRVSHSSLQPDGRAPGAPSAVVPPNTRTSLKRPNGEVYRADTTPPRALTYDEIQAIVRDFASSAANARAAGFDLVELHGAHGYLIHQFLSPEANLRTDAYGGSVEARMRFALEVADAAVAAWSADRIGFRIFPLGGFNGVENGEDQEEASLVLVRELARRGIAYLHLSEPDGFGGKPLRPAFREAIREAFPGPIIAAGGYTPEKADDLIGRGVIDAVAFGRRFIANPDLPARIGRNGPYNPYREAVVYGGGAEGYTDYPTLEEAGAEAMDA